MNKLVIFASGSGSNAENIILHFNKKLLSATFEVFTNNPDAKVVEKATKLNVLSHVFNKQELDEGIVLKKLNQIQPTLIILAGFLLKFPESIIKVYPNKVINIHPALLPKHGGKGMYGMHVHRAVLKNKEKETGITIHYVTENYDEGEFIFQESVPIIDCETAEEIAQKVQVLEHEHFPKVIEKLLTS